MPGLIRLIIIALLIWLAYRLLSRLLNKQTNKGVDKQKVIGNMVRCHVCNLHIPESEALSKGNHHYCSRAHLEQDQQH